MFLHDLLAQFLPDLPLRDVPNPDVTGVCEDSRRVRPGVVFVARVGGKTDGARYLADARAGGAVAAVVSARTPGIDLPQIVHPDPAYAASVLAHLVHGVPCRKLKVLGVTGTNGKTTTTYLLRHILGKVSQRCGMIGTVEIDDGKTRRESDMTTPSACDLAELLGTMRDRGCRAVAMEVSSHALHQKRSAAIDFAGAGFTNLTGDHLDYHGTMEEYAAAKAILFEGLSEHAVAVVNGDDEWTPRMVRDCKGRVFRFSIGRDKGGGDYRATNVEATAQGTAFTLHCPSGKAKVRLPLIGRHNVENALTAAGLAGEVFNLSAEQLADTLATATGAPGRLQAVRCGQPFAVLVDYAHTDDALRNVLTALRPLTPEGSRLRVLFGCGGDRDRTKRPRMARVAEKYADVLYITSDNPRTERPEDILAEIQTGLSRPAVRPTFVDVDRRVAIERVIRDAGPGDVVLIAGKGHENYQIIGTQKHHFDDTEEARRVLGATVAA